MQREFTIFRSVLLGLLVLSAGGAIVFIGGVVWLVSAFDRDNPPFADSSRTVLAGMDVRLDRYAIHPFLAEFKRVVTVRMPGGSDVVTELESDSGGFARLAVCETAAGRIVMTDIVYAYKLLPDGSIASLDRGYDLQLLSGGSGKAVLAPEPPPVCTHNLGAFDKTPDGGYGFLADVAG